MKGLDSDAVILLIVGLLAVLMFGTIVYVGLGPEHGPSMYNDAIQIREGPT